MICTTRFLPQVSWQSLGLLSVELVIAAESTPMADIFVGDNDHGDAVPPTDVLLQTIKTLREDVVHLANELNEVTSQRDCARRERDEARRECRLLLLGQDVLRGVRDLPAPPDDLVTIVPVPQKEDGK